MLWRRDDPSINLRMREQETCMVGRFTLGVGKDRANAKHWTWRVMVGDGLLWDKAGGKAASREQAKREATAALIDEASREYAAILAATRGLDDDD